jgi:hypothetical protein
MIKDTFPQRGIFISRGAGNYGNDMGLQPYLLTQGFVRKLMPGPVKEGNGIFGLEGFGWFDFARTQRLWTEVYRGKQALLNQKRWIDPSSASIPFAYLLTAAALGEGMSRSGKTAEANQMYVEAREIAKVAGLDNFLQPPATPPPSGDSQTAGDSGKG